MGISGNNSVGSVQTQSVSKQRGGQADGGNISHHTGNGLSAVRVPERRPPLLRHRAEKAKCNMDVHHTVVFLFFFFKKHIWIN